MKAIAPVIAIILMVLITIAMVGFAFVFFTGLVGTTSEEAESMIGHQAQVMGERFEIVVVQCNEVMIRNMGTSDIPASSLSFYIDDVKYNATGSDLATGQIVTFTVTGTIPLGTVDLKIMSTGYSDQKDVVFYSGEIPSGLVSYWSFDEDSGNTIYDSAGSNHAVFDSQRLDIDESTSYWHTTGSPTLETTTIKEGSGAIRLSEPTSQWAQIGIYQGTLDVSQWEQADNSLTGKLHYWLYIYDMSLSYPIGIEFGNDNNANQAYWNTILPVSGAWQNGWNLVELDFETANYRDLGSIDWTQVDHFEFYVNTNTSTTNYFILDDFRINNKTTPVWTAGQHGAALSFDGVDDYLDCGNSMSINPNYITIEAWIKTTQTVWGGIGTFDTAFTFSLAVSKYSSGGDLSVITKGVDLSFSEQASGSLGINDGVWHHIAGSYDGNYQRIYVDGVQVGAWAYIAGVLDYYGSAQGFKIGYRSDIPSASRFNGTIDKVRIYDRALTRYEILEAMNA